MADLFSSDSRTYLARERDRAGRLVTDEMVDAMTIVGTPKQCREQIQAFFEAGGGR
jgi:alkanesulfonate monooxygenase SsuD/methylene tetrahydromethanopterin reductase-like flavin-dependent oxidoreductase (luciferase family)